MDIYGMLHVITPQEYVKVTIKILDHYLKLAREQSKKHGQVANQLTVIFDMDGFNLKQYLWRPGKISQVKPGMLRKFSMQSFSLFFIVHNNFLFYCYLMLLLSLPYVTAGELVLTLIQMYEANYPEILKTCFIINGRFNRIIGD